MWPWVRGSGIVLVTNTLHITTNAFATVSLLPTSKHEYSLFTSLDIDLHSRGAFVQEFVSNPLLIDER